MKNLGIAVKQALQQPIDFERLYYNQIDKIKSLEKSIAGLRGRNTILENEIKKMKRR